MNWNLILKFFSLLILVVQALYLMNPTDATLAPRTYMTIIPDEKHFNYDFYVCLEAK